MSNYWKKKLDELNQSSAESSSSSTKSNNYWQSKMLELEEESKKKEEKKKKDEDIAPAKSTLEQALEWHSSLDGPVMADLTKKDDEEKDKRTWFQKGALKDGVTASTSCNSS